MFAEIISLKLQEGTAQDVRKLVDQKIAPWLRQQRGFHGLHMVQVSDVEMIAFNSWSSRADFEAIKKEEQQVVQQVLGRFLISPPTFVGGEVVIHAAGHEPLHGTIGHTR